MPYIDVNARKVLDDYIGAMLPFIHGKGEYNYIITRLLHAFIKRYRMQPSDINKTGLCYDSINDVIGILECAKLELYSQVARPYEDKKKVQNGNISELDAE